MSESQSDKGANVTPKLFVSEWDAKSLAKMLGISVEQLCAEHQIQIYPRIPSERSDL